MSAMVVSISETFKYRRVAKLDLHQNSNGQILPFMRHDRRLGKLLLSLIRQKGVTAQALADVICVEKGTMSKKLNGIASFDDTELEKLGKYFGIEGWKLYALSVGVDPEKLDFSDAYDVVAPGFRKEIIRIAHERKGESVGD